MTAAAQPPPPALLPSRRAVIALGSNLGDRLANLQGGVDALFAGPGLSFRAVSPVYQTRPVGGPDQSDFLNAVLTLDTALPARAVLDRAHDVEAALHRVREERWGPRTLDLDLIVCGEEVSEDPALTLPHPRAHERAFVLAPWHDLEPDARLPGHGPIAVLLGAADRDGVERAAGAELRPPAC